MVLANYKGSIKKRLVLIILMVVFVTAGIGYSVFIYSYMTNQQKKTTELSQSIGLVLSQDFAKLVLLNQVSVGSDITAKLKSFSSLHSMVLYNPNSIPVYQYHANNLSFTPPKLDNFNQQNSILLGNTLKLVLEAKYQTVNLGTIIFEFKVDTLWEVFKRDLPLLISLSILMLILSYILSVIFAKKFTDPILKLVSFLEKVELSDSLKNQTIETSENNEFGKLYDEVNIMLHRIYLADKEQRVASVAFETQSGMTITDANQKILKINKAFTKITGYEEDEVIGQTPAILKSGFQDKEFYQNMWNTLQNNNYFSGEIYNKHKNGKIYPEHITIQAVLDDNGEIIYYVAAFVDLSLQKHQERSIKEKETILLQQSKMASMGEMLENIAHQWRQPLSMITTSSSGIKMQKELEILSDEDLIVSLDKITQAAMHLSETIDDFRNFLKDDSTQINFSIKDSIEKSMILLTSRFKNKNITIIVTDFDIHIKGYKNELIQVFMNILNNAFDALDNIDNDKRLIAISAIQQDDFVKISFQDSANGIPDTILPRIFDHKFTTKAQTNGTGIGLYMSKLIIAKSKGTIEATNETFDYDGTSYYGANFSITLPIN
jgi:two-component system, NtrC family, sensor histidine kinase AtoS